MHLRENRLAPFTFTIGFLKAPLLSIRDAVREWYTSLGWKFTVSPVETSLEESLHRLEPLTGRHDRKLWLETRSPWVAYFDNGLRGPDPFSPVGHLSRSLKCWGLIVMCVPHTYSKKAKDNRWLYGAVQFQLFRPEPRPGEILNYERVVSAVYDANRWVFCESGPVQPFEEPGRYKAARIVDRFTPEMLERYCEALEIRLFDGTFYGPKGILIDHSTACGEGNPRLTLDEARYQLGLEP